MHLGNTLTPHWRYLIFSNQVAQLESSILKLFGPRPLYFLSCHILPWVFHAIRHMVQEPVTKRKISRFCFLNLLHHFILSLWPHVSSMYWSIPHYETLNSPQAAGQAFASSPNKQRESFSPGTGLYNNSSARGSRANSNLNTQYLKRHKLFPWESGEFAGDLTWPSLNASVSYSPSLWVINAVPLQELAWEIIWTWSCWPDPAYLASRDFLSLWMILYSRSREGFLVNQTPCAWAVTAFTRNRQRSTWEFLTEAVVHCSMIGSDGAVHCTSWRAAPHMHWALTIWQAVGWALSKNDPRHFHNHLNSFHCVSFPQEETEVQKWCWGSYEKTTLSRKK